MQLYIASDHGGFNLKEAIIKFLTSKGIAVTDMGPYIPEPSDNYPDYVLPVMKNLQEDTTAKAILICRNGVGVSMLANKFKGIRAALSWNAQHAKSARLDDNSNVLALPADYISELEAQEIVQAWLTTEFSGEERHVKRLQEVSRYGSSGNI